VSRQSGYVASITRRRAELARLLRDLSKIALGGTVPCAGRRWGGVLRGRRYKPGWFGMVLGDWGSGVCRQWVEFRGGPLPAIGRGAAAITLGVLSERDRRFDGESAGSAVVPLTG
jgi:hypothetical protein